MKRGSYKQKGYTGNNSPERIAELRALAEKYKETQWEYWRNAFIGQSSVCLGNNFHIIEPDIEPEE